MRKPSILLVSCIWFIHFCFAQNVTDNKQVVLNYSLNSSIDRSADLPFFASSADGEKIVADIMNATGLHGSFKIRSANVPNVEATIKHHEHYIFYNPDFINKVNTATGNKWASIFILAHEVGHHMEGHTLSEIKDRPDVELQADQFAGFVLCKMGATLQQAQLAMYYISDINASKTHPGRTDRLTAIRKGWKRADAQMQKFADNSTSSQK